MDCNQTVITIGQHQRNTAFHPESYHKAALPLTSIMNEQLIMHQEFCFKARGTIKYGDVVIRARCSVAVGTAGSEKG